MHNGIPWLIYYVQAINSLAVQSGNRELQAKKTDPTSAENQS